MEFTVFIASNAVPYEGLNSRLARGSGPLQDFQVRLNVALAALKDRHAQNKLHYIHR
jgi:hypothetical protein